jgi:hypothetical protein
MHLTRLSCGQEEEEGMRGRYLFMTVALGLSLASALLWLLSGSSASVIAAPVDEPGLSGKFAEARMGVYYGHDEAAGMYAIGHTFWITVTDSGGTPKAHASATTTPNGTDGYFAYSDGFCVEKDDWSDPLLDIQPGDWVQFDADDGFTNSVHVGAITGRLNPDADTVAGTMTAPWFVEPLQGGAGIWGIFWRTFSVDPNGGFYSVDFSPDDVLPGMEITVLYSEPDKDQVGNNFRALWQVFLPVVLRN